jgi:hypothetical protein
MAVVTGVTSLLGAISAAVVTRLSDAGYPPLVAGGILLGEQHLAENDAPPKIVMIPHSSRYSSKDVSGARPLTISTPYAAEQLTQISNRSVLTDELTFEVHCWGTTAVRTNPATIPNDDYDYTRQLAHCLIAAVDDCARGVFTIEPGLWTRQGVVTLGREFVFGITLNTPVLTQLLPFVPPGTVGQATVVPNGSTGDSVVIPLG